MAKRNHGRIESITRGTGNVFADPGFPDAAKRQAKLRLAYALNRVLKECRLSQAHAVEHVMLLLTVLDQDVASVNRKKLLP